MAFQLSSGRRESLAAMNAVLSLNTSGDTHHKKPNLKTRRRMSAIESPSDLLIDTNKDSLLSTSVSTPMNANGDSYELYDFSHENELTWFLYDTKKLFNRALELFNRSQCQNVNGVWKVKGSFFECKGALRVVQRMCTNCRDSNKPKTKTDLYYVDLMETKKERTVLCHGCMGRHLYKYVGSDENVIKMKIGHFRRQQNQGIVVKCRELATRCW